MTDRMTDADMCITWERADNAPGCLGRIVAPSGQDILIQSDWDWPGVASTFGWDMHTSQTPGQPRCDHMGTDGTVACPDCGYPASGFIRDAGMWLTEHYGATAEDPGYFGGTEVEA